MLHLISGLGLLLFWLYFWIIGHWFARIVTSIVLMPVCAVAGAGILNAIMVEAGGIPGNALGIIGGGIAGAWGGWLIAGWPTFYERGWVHTPPYVSEGGDAKFNEEDKPIRFGFVTLRR